MRGGREALGGISEWKMQQSDQKAKWQPKISGSKHKNSRYTFYAGGEGIPVNDVLIGHTEDRPNQIQMFSLRRCAFAAFVLLILFVLFVLI